MRAGMGAAGSVLTRLLLARLLLVRLLLARLLLARRAPSGRLSGRHAWTPPGPGIQLVGGIGGPVATPLMSGVP